MIGFLWRCSVGLVLLAGAVYTIFFVPIRERTLYQHVSRIAATPEAQDLQGELSSAADDVAEQMSAKLAGAANEGLGAAKD